MPFLPPPVQNVINEASRPRLLPDRYVGIRSLEPVGVHLPGDQNYPGGGPFDPLGLSGDANGFVEQVRIKLISLFNPPRYPSINMYRSRRR